MVLRGPPTKIIILLAIVENTPSEVRAVLQVRSLLALGGPSLMVAETRLSCAKAAMITVPMTNPRY